MIIKVFRYLFVLTLCVLSMSAFSQKVIGVHYYDTYYPLLTLEGNNVKNLKFGALGEQFKDKFYLAESDIQFDLAEEIEYVQEDEEEPRRYMYSTSSEKSNIQLASNSSINLLSLSRDEYKVFLSFLIQESWFFHRTDFLHNKTKIIQSSDVGIIGVTDMDKNGKKEVWLSHKAIHDGQGYMVYELQEQSIKLLSSFCPCSQ